MLHIPGVRANELLLGVRAKRHLLGFAGALDAENPPTNLNIEKLLVAFFVSMDLHHVLHARSCNHFQ